MTKTLKQYNYYNASTGKNSSHQSNSDFSKTSLGNPTSISFFCWWTSGRQLFVGEYNFSVKDLSWKRINGWMNYEALQLVVELKKRVKEILIQRNIHWEKYSLREIFIQRNIHLEKYSFRKIFIQKNIHSEKYSFREIFIKRNIHSEKYSLREIFIQKNIHSEKYSFRDIFIQRNIH